MVMKNIKNIKKIVILILLFVWLFLLKGCYVHTDSSYTVAFDAMDKGLEYQLFYTTKNAPDFSEENSIKYQSTGNTTDFEHHEVEILTSENIKDFRIDFGYNPEMLKIKNISITGESQTDISLDAVIAGFNGEIESYELTSDYLQINSDKGDPNSSFKDLNLAPNVTTRLNYSDLVDVCLMYFMALGFGWYLHLKIKERKKLKNINKTNNNLSDNSNKDTEEVKTKREPLTTYSIIKGAFAIVIVIMALYMLRNFYIEKDNHYRVEFESMDSGIQYQFYYSTNSRPELNEDNSVRYQTQGDGKSFVKHVVYIDTTEDIIDWRIDFGSFPGNVKIKNINVYGKEVENIDYDRVIAGFNKQFDSYQKVNDYLEINSTSKDPYSNIYGMGKPIGEISFNYFKLFICCILIFIILKFLFFILNKLEFKKNGAKSIFAMVVFFLIGAPIILINTAEKDERENRTLAPFPDVFVDNKLSDQATSQFELWFSDRFGLRSKYISVYEKTTRLLQSGEGDGVFQTRIENSKAFLGKDEWIFYKGENSVENYQGINLYTDEQLEIIKQKLVERNEWFEKQGIEYYIYVAPDKQRIYGDDYYPDYINRATDNSKIKQIEKALEGTGVKFVYSDDSLLAHKDEDMLYYKNDTHWTDLGAMYGYIDLIETIRKDFPDVENISTNIEFKYEDKTVGDLTKMLNFYNKPVEYPMFNGYSQFSYETVKEEGRAEIRTINDSKKYKVIVLRDSFAISMLPYISDTFNDVQYFWREGSIINSVYDKQDYIVQEQPDIVIEESVERLIDRIVLNDGELREVK